jgi:hypothetical protein
MQAHTSPCVQIESPPREHADDNITVVVAQCCGQLHSLPPCRARHCHRSPHRCLPTEPAVADVLAAAAKQGRARNDGRGAPSSPLPRPSLRCQRRRWTALAASEEEAGQSHGGSGGDGPSSRQQRGGWAELTMAEEEACQSHSGSGRDGPSSQRQRRGRAELAVAEEEAGPPSVMG